MYVLQRNWENLQRAHYDHVGPYGVPQLYPVYDLPEGLTWIGYNYVRGCDDPEDHGVHFFLDDYQFIRLWNDPDRYLPQLSRFSALTAPDFSPYADFPRALQVWNHYRKHWLARYWQEHGMRVVPTIQWSDETTLEWFLDGEPMHSVVALTTTGMLAKDRYKKWFLDGYEKMMDVIHPVQILWKGEVPKECESDEHMIVRLPSFTERFDRMRGKTC